MTNQLEKITDFQQAVNRMQELFDIGDKSWLLVDIAIADHFLGAVPPIYVGKGFACGEAYSYNTYFCFYQCDDKVGTALGRICTLKELKEVQI